MAISEDVMRIVQDIEFNKKVDYLNWKSLTVEDKKYIFELIEKKWANHRNGFLLLQSIYPIIETDVKSRIRILQSAYFRNEISKNSKSNILSKLKTELEILQKIDPNDKFFLFYSGNYYFLEIPVKSHTHSGLIRTVKREKKLAKNILH